MNSSRLQVHITHYADSKAIIKECSRAWQRAKLSKAEWKTIRANMLKNQGKRLIIIAMKYFDINYAAKY